MEALYQNKNLRLKKVFFNKNEIRLIKSGLDNISAIAFHNLSEPLSLKDKTALNALKRLFEDTP